MCSAISTNNNINNKISHHRISRGVRGVGEEKKGKIQGGWLLKKLAVAELARVQVFARVFEMRVTTRKCSMFQRLRAQEIACVALLVRSTLSIGHALFLCSLLAPP